MNGMANKTATEAGLRDAGGLSLKHDELLPLPEVARRLGGVSVGTVRNWCADRKIHVTKICRRTMIRLSDLDHFVLEQNPPARTEETALLGAI